MNNETGFTVERVHCCVCDGSGKLPKLVFWTKPCSVCDGTGQRQILIHKALTPADAAMVRQSAITGQFVPSSPNYASGGVFKNLFGCDF